jgi:hypothetical protein
MPKKITITKLRRAIKRAVPGQPGYIYIEACTFLAKWIVGITLHTRNTLESKDHRCRVPGTPEHDACVKTVNDCATTELCDKSLEIGSIGSVVLQTRMFWDAALRGGSGELDVPGLIYDGALIKLDEIGADPNEVEASKDLFNLLVMPVAGSA